MFAILLGIQGLDCAGTQLRLHWFLHFGQWLECARWPPQLQQKIGPLRLGPLSSYQCLRGLFGRTYLDFPYRI